MSSIEIQTPSAKPVIAYVIQAVAAYSAIVDALYAVLVLLQIGKMEPLVIAGTFVVSVLVAIASVRVFLGLGARPFKRRLPVSLYLWTMLLLYPITNVLRSVGAFTPAPHFENNELMGAFVAEMGRYAFFIVLIIWAGISKRLVGFLTKS